MSDDLSSKRVSFNTKNENYLPKYKVFYPENHVRESIRKLKKRLSEHSEFELNEKVINDVFGKELTEDNHSPKVLENDHQSIMSLHSSGAPADTSLQTGKGCAKCGHSIFLHDGEEGCVYGIQIRNRCPCKDFVQTGQEDLK